MGKGGGGVGEGEGVGKGRVFGWILEEIMEKVSVMGAKTEFEVRREGGGGLGGGGTHVFLALPK